MRSTRFQPDPLDHALIDFNSGSQPFHAAAVGIILNESYSGCALVFRTTETLKQGQIIRVQVGRLGMMSAQIIWAQVLEENLLKVGLEFLD